MSALRAALAELGLPQLDPATEQGLLGPPFAVSLPPLVGAERTPAVVAAYRRHYAGGRLFDTRLYPGAAQLVRDLRAAGSVLAVATSKPETYAVPIVDRLGLAGEFVTVAGDTLDGARPTKADVVAEALRRLPAGRSAVMVGDRAHDVVGARAHGLGCHGAGWGYGLPGELAGAGALTVLAHPDELRPHLLGDARASA